MESMPPEVSDKNKDDESSKVESFETVTVDDLLNIPLPQDDDVKTNTGVSQICQEFKSHTCTCIYFVVLNLVFILQ